MPAASKAQQRFFGMVRAAQKGEMKNPSSEILDVADDISVKDAKKMAKTKHKGLPEKVKTEGVTYGYKGKKYKKLPAHVKTPAGWGNDDRSELGKAKDAITDKLGITNTKKHGVLAKEELVSERLGGKGYKPYTSLTGKKVSGDWEDSDRGAGNKATRRAGGNVKAKSPTYIAHVVNKGKKKIDPKKNPVSEGKTFDAWKKAAASALGRKKEERKAKPATDAGARARKKLKDAEHHKYVSFLDAPDD